MTEAAETDNIATRFPTGHAYYVPFHIMPPGSDLYGSLQAAAIALGYQQRLAIYWSIDLAPTEPILADLVRFQGDFPKQTVGERYVLYVSIHPAHEAALHESLQESGITALVRHHDRLQLVGSSTPTHELILRAICQTPDQTADSIAHRVSTESGTTTNHILNELSDLARRRLVGRWRRLPYVGEFSLIRRNRWHYFPI